VPRGICKADMQFAQGVLTHAARNCRLSRDSWQFLANH
jgi:hypothetical protein